MKSLIKSTILVCLIIVLGAMPLLGCDQQAPVPEEPENMSYEAQLFFINAEYVETGNESLAKLLIEERIIEVPEGENSYVTLLEALALVTDETKTTMITDAVTFNDVYQSQEDEEMIVVDLGEEGLSSGSFGEAMFISQIVETLLNNEEITGTDGMTPTKVQFLVNGEITETLMGHIDSSEPFISELQ
jgi:germination protein M